jgi:putative ABC transport system permease protein
VLALFHSVVARIRGFLRPGDSESDFDQEIASHLAMAEEDGIRRGLTREEARRAARVQLGGVTQLRESWRETSGLAWLDGFALDARLGLRMLRRSWGLTLAGGLAMTIVITIAAVVFVFLDEFMGRTAPPLDEGDRIVALQSWDVEAHRRRDVPRRDLERWTSTLQSVEELGGFQTIERRLTVDDRPAEWVRVAEMSAAGFRLARVQPLLGRWIAAADEDAAATPVIVIGHDVWQSRFESDGAVIGKTVRLGDVTHTVVGVMPEGFAFPVNHRYWIPLSSDPRGSLKAAPEGVVFARLSPGVSLEGAQAELSTIGLWPSETVSTAIDARRPRVVPYTFAFTDDVERGELAWQQRIILLLISLLLVPPCLNIAILIYARTVTRQEEFAARFALGASRARIVMQLCVEVLVLSSVAGIAALALTRPILTQIGEVIRRFPELGGSLPFWVTFDFSWRAALFVASLSVLAALIAGLLPALQATGRVLPIALRAMGSRTGVPLGATWTALIIAQVGLALAALPMTMEMAWGHLRPSVLGPGFAAREFLAAPLSISAEGVAAAEIFRRIESELGAETVTYAAALPGAEPLALIEIEEVGGGTRIRRYVRANQVAPTFFDVFQVAAVSGRVFDTRDIGATATTIVDATFVQQAIGNGNAIGRRIRPVPAPGTEPGPWFEIVGIVPDRPANTSQGRMYVPAQLSARAQASEIHLLLRAGRDPAVTSRRLQDIGTNVDSTWRLGTVRRLDEVYGETQMSSNLTSYALAIVTFSVLVLSAAGLYALMSFTVNLRRREIGIRTALGAPRARLLAGIFTRVLWQIGAGLAVGIAVALFFHERMNIEIEGGWHIPGILPVAAIFVMLIGLLAAAGPARRAIRVDPTEALRDG